MKKQLLACSYKPSTDENPASIVEGIVKDSDTGVHYVAAYVQPNVPDSKHRPAIEIKWGPNFLNEASHPTHKRSASKTYVDGKKIPKHWAEIRQQLHEKMEAAIEQTK